MSYRGSAFDGFSSGSGHYDPKEEYEDRKLSASIWIGLSVIFSLILLVAIIGFGQEYFLMFTGNSVTADYKVKGSEVTVYDKDNRPHYIKFDPMLIKTEGNHVTLYYKGDDIDSAQPVSTPGFCFSIIAFFGFADAITLYMSYKNLHVTHHSSQSAPAKNEKSS